MLLRDRIIRYFINSLLDGPGSSPDEPGIHSRPHDSFGELLSEARLKARFSDDFASLLWRVSDRAYLPSPPLHEAERAGSPAGRAEDPALTPRTRTTLELASDVLENPGLWLRTPNPQLGGRPPIDLIGTEEEFRAYSLLNAVDQGLY